MEYNLCGNECERSDDADFSLLSLLSALLKGRGSRTASVERENNKSTPSAGSSTRATRAYACPARWRDQRPGDGTTALKHEYGMREDWLDSERPQRQCNVC